tara:strand:- start:2233 stop:2817 length:585 start_codon:yes stop_codon:yes gene_type:complete
MFSGIIQGTGTIVDSDSNNTFIKTDVDLNDCKIGSSISCNGVCLTATSIKKNNENQFIFCVNIGEETRERSNLYSQEFDKLINIEKSIKIGDELSGHFVYGHVDCVTHILNIQKLESSWDFKFKMNEKMNKFVVEKGSIAINGISLTIAKVESDNFDISIIPHTYDNTNLKSTKVGDLVNIEYDALARYVVKNV